MPLAELADTTFHKFSSQLISGSTSAGSKRVLWELEYPPGPEKKYIAGATPPPLSVATEVSRPFKLHSPLRSVSGYVTGCHLLINYQWTYPANTKHLYNICTTSAQRLRRWPNIVQMLYKCFVFAGI